SSWHAMFGGQSASVLHSTGSPVGAGTATGEPAPAPTCDAEPAPALADPAPDAELLPDPAPPGSSSEPAGATRLGGRKSSSLPPEPALADPAPAAGATSVTPSIWSAPIFGTGGHFSPLIRSRCTWVAESATRITHHPRPTMRTADTITMNSVNRSWYRLLMRRFFQLRLYPRAPPAALVDVRSIVMTPPSP